jgi:hypothetical protein
VENVSQITGHRQVLGTPSFTTMGTIYSLVHCHYPVSRNSLYDNLLQSLDSGHAGACYDSSVLAEMQRMLFTLEMVMTMMGIGCV